MPNERKRVEKLELDSEKGELILRLFNLHVEIDLFAAKVIAL